MLGWFKASQNGASPPAMERDAFKKDLSRVLTRDPYLTLADEALGVISVFDDLHYDRADMDLMSGPMRTHLLKRLSPLGVRQTSGHLFEHAASDTRLHIPKFRALGASPFAATHDMSRRPQDHFVLTPTQTACFLIDQYDTDTAVHALERLVKVQPVNLLRIFDFLENTDRHTAFSPAIGHLVTVQLAAVASDPLRTRRALR